MIKLLERREAVSREASPEECGLRQEITEVRRQLACIDSCFDMMGDAELLDSIIYQRVGLMARYSYLLRKAKAQGLGSKTGISVQSRLSR